MLGYEFQKQAPGVTVRTNGMDRSVTLLDHPLIKEDVQESRKWIDWLHGLISVTSRQCTPNVRKRSFASCSKSCVAVI